MVLQSTEPWISTNDIDGGSVWFGKITDQLKDSQTGIICITPENVNEPWILFEAGAVAKGVEANRVCTLLIGISPTDIKGPLAQFNHTPCTKEGIRKLVGDINKRLKEPLEKSKLTNIFDALWPNLSKEIDEAIKLPSSVKLKNAGRSSEDMIGEILERIRRVENQTAGAREWKAWFPDVTYQRDIASKASQEGFAKYLKNLVDENSDNETKSIHLTESMVEELLQKNKPRVTTNDPPKKTAVVKKKKK